MEKVIPLISISLFWMTSAMAVTLENKDSSSYDIKVRTSSTMSTSISGGTVKQGICSSSCKIEVKGVGDIEASGSDWVLIKDGKLKKK